MTTRCQRTTYKCDREIKFIAFKREERSVLDLRNDEPNWFDRYGRSSAFISARYFPNRGHNSVDFFSRQIGHIGTRGILAIVLDDPYRRLQSKACESGVVEFLNNSAMPLSSAKQSYLIAGTEMVGNVKTAMSQAASKQFYF